MFLFDLNYLSGTYLDFIKTASGRGVCLFAIAILVGLLGTFIEKKSDDFGQITYAICGLIGLVASLFICIALIAAITFPVLYVAASLKDILIARYLYTPELLTYNRELIITVLCCLLVAIPYLSFIINAFKNFAD